MKPYYSDGRVTLWHGKAEEVLPTLTDSSVDVVITDPPYSEKTHLNVRSRKMTSTDRGSRSGADERRRIDLGFDHLTPDLLDTAAAEFARLARRWVLVFSDAESTHLWQHSMASHGLEHVRTGAWIKVGAAPHFRGDRPAAGFEPVSIAHQPGAKRWNGGGKHALWSHPIVLDRGHKGDIRLHTAQKPLSLMAELVSLFTDPDEVVLDPFAGSGTTLLACKRAGRFGLGVEQDEEHCETIARRLAASQPDLFTPRTLVEAEYLPLV